MMPYMKCLNARLFDACELGCHDGQHREDHAPCAGAHGVPQVIACGIR